MMDAEQTLPVLMRQSKLCHTLGLGVRELHKLVREGKVRQIKIGKYAKYCVAEVAAALGLTAPPTRVAMVWNAELKQKSDELIQAHLERFRVDLQSSLEHHRGAIESRLCGIQDQIGRLNTGERGSAPARPRREQQQPRPTRGGAY
jgi:hypothetical protein